jgi:hypothetical protein
VIVLSVERSKTRLNALAAAVPWFLTWALALTEPPTVADAGPVTEVTIRSGRDEAGLSTHAEYVERWVLISSLDNGQKLS